MTGLEERGSSVPKSCSSIPLCSIVVSVAGIEARTLILVLPGDMGRREGEDYSNT